MAKEKALALLLMDNDTGTTLVLIFNAEAWRGVIIFDDTESQVEQPTQVNRARSSLSEIETISDLWS